jgi:hypothetical protein
MAGPTFNDVLAARQLGNFFAEGVTNDRFLAQTYANDEPVDVGLSNEVSPGTSSHSL